MYVEYHWIGFKSERGRLDALERLAAATEVERVAGCSCPPQGGDPRSKKLRLHYATVKLPARAPGWCARERELQPGRIGSGSKGSNEFLRGAGVARLACGR